MESKSVICRRNKEKTVCRYFKPSVFILGALVLITVWKILHTVPVLVYKPGLRDYNNDVTNAAMESEFDRKLSRALNRAAENKKVIIKWRPDEDNKRAAPNKLEWKMDWSCGSCQATFNNSKANESSTSAIVFLHSYVSPELEYLRSFRRRDQLYVWQTGESASTLLDVRKNDFTLEDSIGFNLTMSSRRDSDIYSPYNPSLGRINLTEVLSSKKRLAVAVISNCNFTPGATARFNYISNLLLTKAIQLDAFGSCFNGSTLPVKRAKNDFHVFLSQYKFYFAFENSYHCRDYITEKFYANSFRANAVPVVWGATKQDYVAVAPKGSFIHVEDFKSVGKLINYLKYLDRNDTAYLQYFKWREMKKKVTRRKTGMCQLCRILNGINVDDVYNSKYKVKSPPRPLFTEGVSPRIVPSLRKWLLDDNEDCFRKIVVI